MKRYILTAIAAGMTLAAAHAEYTLKLTQGKFPDGVTVENLNGNLPSKSAYNSKKGWTDQGWIVGDYGQRLNAALSPSFLGGDGVCESGLTLPSVMIEEGEWLSWEGCEVYSVFSDDYTVEFRAAGSDDWTTLGSFSESSSAWSRHMIDLGDFAGMEGEVRFVCRSAGGYMLALSNVVIARPKENSFVSSNGTPKFFGLSDLKDGAAMTEISVLNAGAPVAGAEVCLVVGDDTVASLSEPDVWATGETRTFRLPLPLALNERCDYKVTIDCDGAVQTLDESFAFCSSFRRSLFVDKGTGMWCNSCPAGTIQMEDLQEEYGDAVIAVETHNNDSLADDIDFAWLKFYAIPYFRLNRITSTQGDNTNRFADQICVPTEMDINVRSLSLNADGSLRAEADVRTSGDFAADGSVYRVGYILTRDFPGGVSSYYQQNNCVIARYRQYYYLPSRIPSALCSFPDVSIPSPLATLSTNPAFTGVEGSLPESLEGESTYSAAWDILLPEGYDGFGGMRLVAYVLDAASGVIINSTAVDIDSLVGTGAVDSVSDAVVGAKGVFCIDGRRIASSVDDLAPGLYIIDGKKTLIR